ncbi:MAG: FtsX-like permease family protein [Promethearchaeota archaeon]
MGNRLSFYFSQGSKNLRNSLLIILGLSLALSMVSGISLYIDSYQKNMINESFDQIIDFNVEYHYDSYKENISDNFQAYDSSVISLIQDSENIDIESHFRYFILDTYDFNFYKNYSQLYGLDFHGYEVIYGNFANIGLFDEQFYTSKRFDQYFAIINGTVPKSEEEILIPIDLAYQMNLTLGETTNLDIKTTWESMPSNSSLSLSDVKVVGIYATKLPYYRFAYNGIYHDYTYHSKNNTVTDYESISQINLGSDFVFSYYNFSKAENIHPVQTLIYDIDIFIENYTSEEDYYYYYIDKTAGLAFCFNRDNIDFNHLNSYSRVISQETQVLERQIDRNNVYFRDYLSRHLLDLYFMSNMYRIVLQILNVPILIFAIFIGSFAIKTNAKSRLDEFLLLRSKGAPNSFLRNQFLIEAIFNGVGSSTIALFAGFGTFYGFRALLDDLFFYYGSTVTLSPSISWGTVILTYSLGIGITFLASLSSIVYVRKLPTYKLLTILGSDSMDVEYDEKSLFDLTEGKKVAIEETPFYEKSQVQLNSVEIQKESSSKKIKKKRKKHDLYQNAVQTKEKKIPKLSIAFIIISLFPVIIYILYYFGSLPYASDAFISISYLIEQYFGIVLIFAILSPVLFVIGIIRIIVVEKPTRFARISKFLSSIFLKERSYLCGIEMVKRKQYKTVILLVGIFTSLLVFTNIFLNSISRYNLMIYNVQVGSDVKIWYDDDNMPISNTSDIELLESQLKSYKTSDNETLINQVLTCYSAWTLDDYNRQRYYLDIEKYLDIIQEGNKKLPLVGFVSKIENLIDYNKNSSNLIPGIIVSSGFLTLNKLEIGDLFTFPHNYYNSSSMVLENETITVKIMISTDVMPGLYLTYGYWGSYSEHMIIDINSVNPDKDLLHGERFFQMIDIDPDIEEDTEVLESMLNNATSNFTDTIYIQFFNQNWNDLNYELSVSESGIYGIIYLEFLMIGVLLAFGLAILILSFQRENKYFNGVLLARGFGRIGLLKLILSQIFIIFLIGIFTGLVSGFLTSISFLRIFTIMSWGAGLFSFPIYMNALELVEILGIIVLSSVVIYLVSYYFEAKKNITQYFHKF